MCTSLGVMMAGHRRLSSLVHISCHLGTQPAPGLTLQDIFPFPFLWFGLDRKMDNRLGEDKKYTREGKESLSEQSYKTKHKSLTAWPFSSHDSRHRRINQGSSESRGRVAFCLPTEATYLWKAHGGVIVFNRNSIDFSRNWNILSTGKWNLYLVCHVWRPLGGKSYCTLLELAEKGQVKSLGRVGGSHFFIMGDLNANNTGKGWGLHRCSSCNTVHSVVVNPSFADLCFPCPVLLSCHHHP